MPETVRQTPRVECQECPFVVDVSGDTDVLPAEVVIEHGRETGHKLRVEYPED